MLWKIIVAVLAILVAGVLYLKLSAVRVSGGDARALVANGAMLIDVRTEGEFAGRHIEGAINIPIQELPGRMDELGERAAPIVVYCQSGGRSSMAKKLLESSGFDEVYDLGGIGGW